MPADGRTWFAWTNDDLGPGTADKLQRQVDFLKQWGIAGAFFVVPEQNGRAIDEDAELLRTIERAKKDGHEFYQHGYRHEPFECGVPETWMLEFAPDLLKYFDEHRLELERQHSLVALVAMIEKGRRIWQRAFGEDSPGFRPGWGAFCGNLYRALDALGFAWVSSTIPCPTSWLWNRGQWDYPLNFRDAVPAEPYRIENLLELPIGGDYAFAVPDEADRIDRMVDLGLRELHCYHEHGWPMLMVSTA